MEFEKEKSDPFSIFLCPISIIYTLTVKTLPNKLLSSVGRLKMAKDRKRPASELEKASSAQPAAVSTTAGGDGSAPDIVTPSTNKNEIRFGRHLASSEKRVRDQTVSALREWLFHRSRGGVLTELDLLKVT